MQGVTTLTELRQKLTAESNPLCDKPAATVEEEHDEPRNCSDIGASSVLGSELATVAQLKEQDISEREGWTPVAPSKVARRGQQLPPNRNRIARGFKTQCDEERTSGDIVTVASKDLFRDGNPQIPSPQ
ncbi:unnamed protein product [Amaranthus hypochondriacus]